MARGRILAVDDQRYFRELIEGLLVEEGFEVQTCGSGEEALRLLDHAVFDVIVTDLVMPAMTGIDLVQRVKERDPEQEIIVVTGVVDVQSAVDAMKVGATDYLLKPFDRATLAPALEGDPPAHAAAPGARPPARREHRVPRRARAVRARARAVPRHLARGALRARARRALPRDRRAGRRALVAGGDAPAELRARGARARAARGGARADQRERAARRRCARAAPPPRSSTGASPTGCQRPALVVALRRGDALAGLFRLTDKLGGERFDEVDRACAEKFLSFADAAYRNAERFQRLERRTLQDPDTGAYRIEYLHDVVRNEIEKASRFGRSFSLLKLDRPARAAAPAPRRQAYRNWHGSLARYLGRLLRATDLLAVEGGRPVLRAARGDRLGRRGDVQAAHAARARARRADRRGEDRAAARGDPRLGQLSRRRHPARGAAARARAARHRGPPRARARAPARGAADRRRARAPDRERRGRAGAVGRVAVPVRDRGGRTPAARAQPDVLPARRAVRGRARRRSARAPRAPCDTEFVVLGDPLGIGMAEEGVTWLPADAVAGPPFAVQFGDGPSYVLVADATRSPAACAGSTRATARSPSRSRSGCSASCACRGSARWPRGSADRGRRRGPRRRDRAACRSLGSRCAWRATAPPRSRSRSRTSPSRWSRRSRCR